MSLSSRLVTLVFCGVVPSLTFAKPVSDRSVAVPDRFTIGRYIPAEVWMYMHFAHNPERAWIEKQWQEVFDALKDSGIDQDIISLILSAMSDEERTDAQTSLDKWTALLKAVRWADLVHHEVAFAEQLGGRDVPAKYYWLARGKAGSAGANAAALAAIMRELAALSEQVHLTQRKMGDVDVWSMTFGENASQEIPFSVELLRRGDVIGLTSGPGPRNEIIALMGGNTEKRSIVTTERFQEAISTVKPAEDALFFMDFKALVYGIGQMMGKEVARLHEAKEKAKAAYAKAKGEEHKGEDGEKGRKIIAAIKKGIELCDILDYSVMSVETDGRRELVHNVTRLQESKRKCALTCCFLDRRSFKRFDRYIPAEATGFNLNGFVDLEKLYKLVTDFVRDVVPDGASHMEKWNGILASIGFDPQRDFFSWWSGEMISVTLPPEVVTPMSGPDWVLMFRVKDSELASRKINSAIDFINGKLQAEGQMLMISPATVKAEGFRQVTHPMMMMFMRPVIGVKDDWLMIGSSAAPINKCLDVVAGKTPSILANERFKKEGLIPEGPVMSISFTDTSKFGEELGQAAAMAGMIGGMITAPMPDDPESRKAKQVIQKVMGIIMKLGPVLQKIDFYSSEASMCTYDGALTVRSEKVITYKPPTAEKVKTAAVK